MVDCCRRCVVFYRLFFLLSYRVVSVFSGQRDWVGFVMLATYTLVVGCFESFEKFGPLRCSDKLIASLTFGRPWAVSPSFKWGGLAAAWQMMVTAMNSWFIDFT
jgi:hypothetical protein